MIAIFGGTAAYHLNLADVGRVAGTIETRTEFGTVSFTRLITGRGAEVVFLSRHGVGRLAHSAAFINHRAHVVGALEIGAKAILSWNGVGAINSALNVGDLVVPEDVIDETRARGGELGIRIGALGIGDVGLGGGAQPLVQAPFDPSLRMALLQAAAKNSQFAVRSSQCTYVCTEGPRLETPAEIAAFARLGADVVGMTLCPEVWIAAEVRLPYASLCVVTNMAAGLSYLNAARDFGPEVGAKCLRVCLRAAEGITR